MAGPKKGDDLFSVNDPDEPSVVIDDGEGAEIVFVEELCHFAAVSIDVATDDVTLRQGGKGCLWLRKQELYEGDERGNPFLFVEKINVGDGLDVSFEFA